jgi:hypothetical protein
MTVSGCTTTNAVRQFGQTRARANQKNRSRSRRRHRVVRWYAASCCRSATFSRTSFRWPRSTKVSARTTTMSSSSMCDRGWTRRESSTRTVLARVNVYRVPVLAANTLMHGGVVRDVRPKDVLGYGLRRLTCVDRRPGPAARQSDPIQSNSRRFFRQQCGCA